MMFQLDGGRVLHGPEVCFDCFRHLVDLEPEDRARLLWLPLLQSLIRGQ